jgi:hypothetical protein
MAKPKTPQTAIVCAWRNGETDLDATVESATASIFDSAQIVTVQDTSAQGPARTRHRGIEAAALAEVIIIIDSHMRFEKSTLSALAFHAARKGGVCCPQVYHNDRCAFDGIPYAGARIVYRAKDGKAFTALAGKWSRDHEPGPRGCIMGGCYAFRRDWYYEVGQPLAALPGWGCDEEALSIASWMSGTTPHCITNQAAHLYRSRPPWNVMSCEHAAVYAGRMALIHAVVTEASARRELESWTRDGVPEGVPVCASPEAERFRLALLKLPRKWADWRAQVCEPDELDGLQDRAPRPVDAPAHRTPVRQLVTQLIGVKCTHCQSVHDPIKIKVAQTYPNGNRRHKCDICGNYFISNFRATT